MPDLATQLVIANRILAREDVVDAYGHISARNPDRPDQFLLSRSRSPQHVQLDDIMEFDLEGRCTSDDPRPPYIERFIHAAIYAHRPEVHSVVHAHTEALLPFTITDVPLVPVIHSGSEMGTVVPKWDISDAFGDSTDLLVSNMDMGNDLADRLGSHSVVLMRGHGFAAADQSILTTVGMTVYLARNARVLLAARNIGAFKPLSAGEAEGRKRTPGSNFDPDSPAVRRSWDYWATRAGCAELLDD
ncbi:class II aldolase/adducin family protein [Nocardioides sp. 1609]|uniref:class II aldolase/adducin family protein n=1 Tax=Nocardioides sp. 1609 TaxID=2508327 RepID=UPI00106FFC5A|nr:class II aldolase/adducin family protein [Nocardioides sp. 1609]